MQIALRNIGRGERHKAYSNCYSVGIGGILGRSAERSTIGFTAQFHPAQQVAVSRVTAFHTNTGLFLDRVWRPSFACKPFRVTERPHLCRRTALSFAGIRHISYAKAHYSGFRSIAGLNSRSALARGSTKRKITFCPADATISSNRVALLPRAKTRLGHNQPVTVVNCWSAWPLCSGRLIFTVAQTRKCACCRVATSPTSSGLHLWISNLFRRFCSASTGLRLSAVGVKNLIWHLLQVARYGALPLYFIIYNSRSHMMTAFHRFAECCQIP